MLVAFFGALALTGTPDSHAGPAAAQPPPAPQPRGDAAGAGAEYRKLDELLSFIRRRNTAQYAVKSPRGIDEGAFVTLGGIEQWITIRGQDRDNPVLLFLHGGPGDAISLWSYALLGSWEERFTVVQWDQRGAGHTLRRNGPSIGPTITLDRMAKDGCELAEHLRKRLGKDRVVLVGHSFGSLLGLRMARARPDLFYAFVGTGQVGDSTRNYAVAYEALLAKARAAGNRRALDDLTRVGPPPYPSGEGYGVQRTWSNAFEGADRFLATTLGFALTAPGGSVADFNDQGDGQILSGERLVPQIKSLTPKDFGLEFAVPIFFFQGAEDFTTPTALARQYFDALTAPRKEFVTIPGGGHFAVFIHADEFLRELANRVLPLTRPPVAGANGSR